MKMKNFVDGLNILRPYFDDPDGYHIGSEHDQFYVYQTNHPLTPEDVAKMRALGWFQPDARIPDEPEGAEAPYNPEDGWSAYT